MLIAYDSKTGNVKRFVEKLNLDCVRISEETKLTDPFILITYTTGFGQVPQSTMQFLEEHGHLLQGVASSGNMNWGIRYGLAADHISRLYSVPVLMKFELSGTKKDVEQFSREVHYFDTKMDTA
ncbi:class Ib ribonucleoside-diphosphate reductase assembly flavoprotein NrdI [Paenibacillus thiaminolyticus]|uniref:Protein NrdI n=1 Tax=Paenibacillus thiaminolyticus TaxID=49283 RepID=A0AAP9DQL8_PANTH|nr:class Ib ribonucleoside-diphosphate reductase assembly flavoprotein NrdI [Paenibacillus thiaminolyticus]MCY9536749.1 class Ib ribonucleoside-diphosphate reductase assembly flavoprotein NrdI [Paenibacillus thiaminolyticus]MCY9600548.1 class Ib ribonucleoside-diphosphate reductase assembly flavoprotein NrdI [Paenibacillus thiaminolyticus]MCY9606571.1 class Ib ribonucleoside-diphosphate reductase assembly flavoprotein NrdI [Paenibacillus thiaminolyticus]MCY9614846.1 class Ib ribonucleoside-diph